MPEALVQSDFSAWTSAARDVVTLLHGDETRLRTVVPEVSGWSALHHAAHLTLANERVLANLASLAKGSGLLVVYEAAQVPEALGHLAAGRLPRGRAQSPRMVVPPADIDVETAREWADKLATDLDAFARAVDVEHVPRCFVPHQLLGPLDFAQWARFGRVHTEHHLAIAREVMAARR